MSSSAFHTNIHQRRVTVTCRKLEGHTAQVSCILHLPDEQRIMTCSYDGSLRIWNFENGAQIGNDWRDGESAVITLALSPDGKKVVSGSGDGAIRLWDVEAGKVITKWMGHTGSVKSLCWNQDGERVVSGSFDGTAQVWDVRSGKVILGPLRTGYDVDAVIYSPDNSMIATGVVTFPEKEYIKIWDEKTGKLIISLRGHQYTVTCLAWSTDGKTLFSGSLGDSISMWNTATWEQIANFNHASSALAIAISPDGCFLASALFDGTVRLWNIENGQLIGSPIRHTKSVSCLSFSANGNLLATGCSDNNAYLSDISEMSREPQVGLSEPLDDSSKLLLETNLNVTQHMPVGRRFENVHQVPGDPSNHPSHQPHSRSSGWWRLPPRHHGIGLAFLSRISSLFTGRSSDTKDPSLRLKPIGQVEEITAPINNEADARLCSVCSAIDLHAILLDGVPEEHALPLGYLVDILNKCDECGLCRLIAILIRRSWNLDKMSIDIAGITCALYAEYIAALDTEECVHLHIPSDALPSQRDICHRLRIKTFFRPQEVTTAIDAAQSSFLLEIQLLEEDSYKVGRTKELHGRRVDQNLDIGLLKRWIHICENEHRERCETLWWKDPTEVLPKFIRVLDIIHMAIVPAPRSCRYIALSYIWGGPGDDYWTTQANLKQRSRRGGLDISMLPVTIQDTIQLVRQLGERYLWIDALCIVQDDTKDKGNQIGAMDLVYGFSKFTIFAAGGSSVRDPLPGVRPGTRDPKQEVAKIQGLHLALPLALPREAIVSSEWNTRGWTYQELMLSRRRIFFTSHSVHFECTKDVFCEDIIAERINFPWASHPLMFNHAEQLIQSGARIRDQSMVRRHNQQGIQLNDSGYMTMVQGYTQRRLTFESDIINAITALINAMTKGFQWAGGDPDKAFWFAMPLGDLEIALVWQPAANAPHERCIVPDKSGTSAPSWSWVAWRGAVLYGGGYTALASEDTGSPPKIRESLVAHWHIVDSNGKLVRQDVQRTGRTGDGAHWATYLAPKGNIDERQLIGDSAPLVPGTLVFRTSSAHFDVERDGSISDDAEANYAIYHILSDIPRSSTRVGRILLPCSIRSPTSCEFIVLSRTTGRAGWFDEHRLDEHGNLARLGYDGCMFYVMAVQKMKDEERMERLGVGVILDRAWLNSITQHKIVFLG